jgi:hypothetical protein
MEWNQRQGKLIMVNGQNHFFQGNTMKNFIEELTKEELGRYQELMREIDKIRGEAIRRLKEKEAAEYYDEGFYHGRNDATPVSTNVNYMNGWNEGHLALELSAEKEN